MTQQTQLIITHGNSDLQLLLRTQEGELFRALTNAKDTKAFHQWILANPEEFELVELPEETFSRDQELKLTTWQNQHFSAEINNAETTLTPALNSSGKMQLVLPKIAPVINAWLTTQKEAAQTATPNNAMAAQLASLNLQSKAQPIHSVLVLSTNRHTKPDEPLASFTYIQKYFVNLGLKEEQITELVYLNDGDERIEDNNKLIKDSISNRLEKRLRQFYHQETNPQLAIVSIGGIPLIKDWLFEYGRLLAGKKVINLDKTENTLIGERQLSKLDEIKVRRQCLQQIQQGALLNAYALAAPFHNEPSAQKWVEPLEAAAALINGNPIKEQANAPLPALQQLLKAANAANCLLVAIRVEHALLTNLWFEALTNSITFLEAALNDGIQHWAKTHLKNYQPENNRRRMVFNQPPAQILITSGAVKDEGRHYFADTVGEQQVAAWAQTINLPSLIQLNTLLYTKGKFGKQPNNTSLIDFRNNHAHGMLSQKRLDNAIKMFMQSNYWAQGLDLPTQKPKPGNSFLSRPLVNQVLNEVLQNTTEKQLNAQHLYQQLLNQLEQILINPNTQF